MFRWVLLALLAISGIAIILSGSAEEIRIGVSAPASGPVAQIGTWAVNGMVLAVDEINGAGGINGKPIRLLIEDDKCSASEGIRTINKLVYNDRVSIIIVYCGAVTGTAASLAENSSVIYSISVRTEPLEGRYPFLFSMAPPPELEAKLISQHMISRNISRVTILHQSDFFGETYKNKFKKSFAEMGGIVSLEGSLDNFQSPDFRSDISKAKEAGADAIFTSFNPAQYGIILRQAKELGFNGSFYSVWNTQSSLMLNVSGELAEGIIYTYSFKEPETEKYKNFRKRYTERFGTEPDYNAANGYDAIMIASAALKKCREYECIINNTRNISHTGFSGTFSFVNGSATKDVFLKTVRNGTFEELK